MGRAVTDTLGQEKKLAFFFFFFFAPSLKENNTINMLKINYFYFKRAKTAQTNTELVKRAWLKVPQAYS